MRVLGIETSCDETAASVVADGKIILSNVVISQVDVHREYGGVVPELASRHHVEAIGVVVEQALSKAGMSPQEIDGIAVTRGPGLIGALLVGISAAKGMATALDIPVSGVNHLHGHLFAPLLEGHDLKYPFVGLVVSGGHTSLYLVEGPLEIQLMGSTRDDAAGEAFDKVAKLLGLGYPGGPVIEKASQGMDPGDLRFPRALMDGDSLDFSFSGLKTAVLRCVESTFGVTRDSSIPGSFHPLVSSSEESAEREEVRRIGAAFQEAVVEVLVVKALKAAKLRGVAQLVVCGGVAANRNLRESMHEAVENEDIEAIFPSLALCTDNGAMIAARGHQLLSRGLVDDLGFDAKSRW